MKNISGYHKPSLRAQLNLMIASMLALFNDKGDKRGQFQIATATLFQIGSFILGAIIIMVFVGVLVTGNFFTATSAEQLAIGNLSGNLTAGVNSIGTRLPTIFVVIGIILILSFIIILYTFYKRMNTGGNFGQ